MARPPRPGFCVRFCKLPDDQPACSAHWNTSTVALPHQRHSQLRILISLRNTWRKWSAIVSRTVSWKSAAMHCISSAAPGSDWPQRPSRISHRIISTITEMQNATVRRNFASSRFWRAVSLSSWASTTQAVSQFMNNWRQITESSHLDFRRMPVYVSKRFRIHRTDRPCASCCTVQLSRFARRWSVGTMR